MTKLTDIQQEIRTSLETAIKNNNLETVQEIFNSNGNDDIQAVLRERIFEKDATGSILSYVTYPDENNKENKVKIIKLIWEKANQKTRNFMCDAMIISLYGGESRRTNTIDDLKIFQGTIDPNDTGIYPVLEKVIQEIEEHKRVMVLGYNLEEAIKSLDVNQVKAALENCGTDIEKVLMQEVRWSALLVYPLMVDYKRNLDKEEFEKIKEITKLLWDKASHNVRNSWLEDNTVDEKGQNTGNSNIIAVFEGLQKYYVEKGIADEGWLEDLIKEVEGYKKSKERIAQNDRKIAEELQNEEKKDIVDSTASSVSDSNTSPAPTTGNTTPGNNDAILLGNDTVATATSASDSNTNPAPTIGNKTPGNSDTNFWSKHKGKIALGVTGLCVAGAVAAYVLAYPAVALALAVLAAVILMGVGIAKVCEKVEDPSVEKPFTPQQGV